MQKSAIYVGHLRGASPVAVVNLIGIAHVHPSIGFAQHIKVARQSLQQMLVDRMLKSLLLVDFIFIP